MTALVTSAVGFAWVFFVAGKAGRFRAVSPFGEDPYDAVGSIALQVALLVGVLTYARALGLCGEPALEPRARLIRRGNTVVLAAIAITLAADSVAVALHPVTGSPWGRTLLAGLVAMWLLSGAAAVTLAAVFFPLPVAPAPTDAGLADAVDDLLWLARLPAQRARPPLPRRLALWLSHADCDHLFRHISWLHPRGHPWRFAGALGLIAGVVLMLAQLREGVPRSLGVGLAATGIFVVVEAAVVVGGFALLGGYLGLRPGLKR